MSEREIEKVLKSTSTSSLVSSHYLNSFKNLFAKKISLNNAFKDIFNTSVTTRSLHVVNSIFSWRTVARLLIHRCHVIFSLFYYVLYASCIFILCNWNSIMIHEISFSKEYCCCFSVHFCFIPVPPIHHQQNPPKNFPPTHHITSHKEVSRLFFSMLISRMLYI